MLREEKRREKFMTDKELRKLGRTELLELLIGQAKENETLKIQISEQAARIGELEAQLQQRTIMIDNAGSIAEASLQLNGVFEAAQKAAQEYLDNVRLRYQNREEYAKRAEAETNAKVEQMLRQAERRCKLLESVTSKRCEEMTEKARTESQEYWQQVSAKVDEYIKQRADLRELLSVNYSKI